MTNQHFQQLVQQYERLVFSVCYQLVRDYQEAQNLTQDTFVSAFTHIDSAQQQNLRAWLARIATNKAKDHLKSAYHRKICLSEDMSELDLLRSEQSPERLYLADEGAGHVRQTVLALKEPYHKVAALFFLEERTIDEISLTLDRPKKTVQTQLYRARQMLQTQLKEEQPL